MRHPSPLLQLTANSEDQVANVWRPLTAMIRLGPLSDLLLVREDFIRIVGSHADDDDLDRIDMVTSRRGRGSGTRSASRCRTSPGSTRRRRGWSTSRRRSGAARPAWAAGRSRPRTRGTRRSSRPRSAPTSRRRPTCSRFMRQAPAGLSTGTSGSARQIHAIRLRGQPVGRSRLDRGGGRGAAADRSGAGRAVLREPDRDRLRRVAARRRGRCRVVEEPGSSEERADLPRLRRLRRRRLDRDPRGDDRPAPVHPDRRGTGASRSGIRPRPAAGCPGRTSSPRSTHLIATFEVVRATATRRAGSRRCPTCRASTAPTASSSGRPTALHPMHAALERFRTDLTDPSSGLTLDGDARGAALRERDRPAASRADVHHREADAGAEDRHRDEQRSSRTRRCRMRSPPASTAEPARRRRCSSSDGDPRVPVKPTTDERSP
jgi:hypothetical protein